VQQFNTTPALNKILKNSVLKNRNLAGQDLINLGSFSYFPSYMTISQKHI